MAFPFQSFFVRNDRKKPQQQQPAPHAPPSAQAPLPGGGGGGYGHDQHHNAHAAHTGQAPHPHQNQQQTADYYADPLSLPGIIVPGAAQANANATAGTHHYSSAPHFTIPASSNHSSPQLTYHAGRSTTATAGSASTPAVSPYLGYQQQQYPHYQQQQQATYPSATTPQPQPPPGGASSAVGYPPTTPTYSAPGDPTTPTTPGLSSQLQHLSTSAPTTPAADARSMGGGGGANSDAWSLRSRRSSVATSIAPVDEEVTDVHIDEIIVAANEIAAIAASCKPNVDGSGTTPPPTVPVTVADLLTTPTGSRQFMLLWRRTLDLCAAVVRIRDNVSLQGTLDDLEGDDMEEIRRRRYLGSLTGGGVGPGNRVRSKSRGSVKSTKSDGTAVLRRRQGRDDHQGQAGKGGAEVCVVRHEHHARVAQGALGAWHFVQCLRTALLENETPAQEKGGRSAASSATSSRTTGPARPTGARSRRNGRITCRRDAHC
ncbi:hypothetical protein BCR44DRAFT_1012907 [Catenaria anguillulae PL171]|uniref:Uncharacterized protein n=1 Tax=Catenaria anguillulae PL171 TaxID=765915 RepID=A0A1Y2I4B7_9FUNG|nr:hypothetical protein BCR44DRAFT_1012907 [Catenaria anguillulae PL171]